MRAGLQNRAPKVRVLPLPPSVEPIVALATYNGGMPYKDAEKQRQAQHESYLRNKDKVHRAAVGARLVLRDEIRALKERTPCADCKLLFPHYVTDYDHREGVEKVYVISKIIFWHGRAKVMEEIAKCDLVCSNCHRIRTHERRVNAAGLLLESSILS